MIFVIKSRSSSVASYTHADLTAVTSPRRHGNTKSRHWDWVLKVKTLQREREVPQKRLNDITKTNPIRLWKMFSTKSETQWCVMRVLWLIKVFPWKNCSCSPSLSLTHMFYLSLHTRKEDSQRASDATSHAWIPTFRCRANCSSMGKYWSTFNGIQSTFNRTFSFKTSHKKPLTMKTTHGKVKQRVFHSVPVFNA